MKWVSFALILLSMVAEAAPTSRMSAKTVAPKSSPVQFVISPFAFEHRIEAETNPVFDNRETRNFALGIRYRRNLFTIEHSKFQTSSGNETFTVDREFQDYLAWYRYHLIGSRKLRGLLGGGIGFYQEDIKTNFYGVGDSTSTGAKWSAAMGLGAEFEPARYVTFLLEARLISGQNLDPNPNPSFLARMSFQF